jgi:hypothetical protein
LSSPCSGAFGGAADGDLDLVGNTGTGISAFRLVSKNGIARLIAMGQSKHHPRRKGDEAQKDEEKLFCPKMFLLIFLIKSVSLLSAP